MPKSLLAQLHPLASAPSQRAQLAATLKLRPFSDSLQLAGIDQLTSTGIETLQINLGKLCNQTCKHCHVDAGPDRTEVMPRDIMDIIIRIAAAESFATIDITGGAPELNPNFRWLVTQLRPLTPHLIDRCNLTILMTGPHQDLPEFLTTHRVEIVASLPHVFAKTTNAQRGDGVFELSLAALRRLNQFGYGQPGSGLVLNLVYNPAGAFLAPSQSSIEPEYRGILLNEHKIIFNDLYVLNNLPISRFLEFLVRTQQFEEYMARLVSAFNPAAARGVMCRTTLSVAWDGTLHDCDFNQMLELPVLPSRTRHLRDFDPAALRHRPIATGNHCYGCTAGQGSTCTGTILKETNP